VRLRPDITSKLFCWSLVSLALLTPARGQTGPRSSIEVVLAEAEARFAQWERERLEAQWWEERQFFERARKFVELWNTFVEKYNRGEVDLQLALKVSEAFRALERSRRWPAKPQKTRRAKSEASVCEP